MKFLKLLSTLLISAVFVASCNKPQTSGTSRVEFDLDKFSAYVGKPISTFSSENADYLVGTSMTGRTLLAYGFYEIDGTDIDVNIFVNADYAGTVNRVLVQPVSQTTYARSLWEHFTSAEVLPTLGTFVKAKYRSSSNVVGECATLAEAEQKYQELSADEPLMCAVCRPAGADLAVVPLLQSGTGALLVTDTHTTVYYPDLASYFYTDYSSVRNEFFFIGDAFEGEEARYVTVTNAGDVLDHPVTVVFNGSTDISALQNIIVSPVASDATSLETFWREFLDNTEKLGFDTFYKSSLVGTDGKDVQTFSTKAAALSHLNQNGAPSDGSVMKISYSLSPIIYTLCITADDVHVDIHTYSSE